MVSEFEWPQQWAEHWVEVTSKQDVGVCPLECIQRLSGDGGEQGAGCGYPWDKLASGAGHKVTSLSDSVREGGLQRQENLRFLHSGPGLGALSRGASHGVTGAHSQGPDC